MSMTTVGICDKTYRYISYGDIFEIRFRMCKYFLRIIKGDSVFHNSCRHFFMFNIQLMFNIIDLQTLCKDDNNADDLKINPHLLKFIIIH